MTKKKAKRKTPHFEARRILAQNLRARMDQKFAHVGDKPSALAKKSGVSLSRVQDALKQIAGVSIDTVGKLADALDCTIADLTTDLDEKAPEIVTLWADTDDFGQTNILQSARAWHKARPRPRSKPHAP